MGAGQIGLWRQAEKLFDEALLYSSRRRQTFVEQASVGDRALRSAVASLLANDEAALTLPSRPDRYDISLGLEPTPHVFGAGRRVGAYELLRRIGEGGMGLVYFGQRCDGENNRSVAVKLIRDGSDRALRQLFLHERKILGRLSHPNIAQFLESGVTEAGWPYVVLEYIEGLPITDFCDVGRLSVRQRLRLLIQVCQAVDHAHQHLIVHRDLKPSNILVTDQGRVKLLDFGIATLMEPSGAETPGVAPLQDGFLTPGYASPEQVAGSTVTTAVDQYAIGVLLYLSLTGLMPCESLRRFGKGTPVELPPLPSIAAVFDRSTKSNLPVEDSSSRARARGTTPGRLARQLRGDLDNIVMRCLRHSPRQRYGSIKKLAEDLRRFLGDPVDGNRTCCGQVLRPRAA